MHRQQSGCPYQGKLSQLTPRKRVCIREHLGVRVQSHNRDVVQAMRGWETPAQDFTQDEHSLLRVMARSAAKVNS
jgi:hypothetical protein